MSIIPSAVEKRESTKGERQAETGAAADKKSGASAHARPGEEKNPE
jgi:hypothetical protein